MAKRQRQFGEQEREVPPHIEMPAKLVSRIKTLAKQRSVPVDEFLQLAVESLSEEARPADEANTKNDPSPQSQLPRSSPRVATIKNRTGVIRTSTAIIKALQEVLDYNPKLHHNQTPPELWIDDAKYISAIMELVEELRALNSLLRANKISQEKEYNAVVDLGVHVNRFLKEFTVISGKGAGWLLIASLGGLLYHTGLVPDIADVILKHIKIP
jgi:hypothetical protein